MTVRPAPFAAARAAIETGPQTRTRSASAGYARRSTKPASVSTTTVAPPCSASHSGTGDSGVKLTVRGTPATLAARATWVSETAGAAPRATIRRQGR